MRVLVACEESQAVCKAFRKRGHEAYSCDILPCSGGHPEWHIQDDVLKHLNEGWDLIIAHPPCTYLSAAGACRLYKKEGNKSVIRDYDRLEKGREAKDFFMQLLNAPCKKICVENPMPMKIFGLPPHTQEIQPYKFGFPYSKRTRLWLKGLPPLLETQPNNKPIGHRDSRTRSKTPQQVADAMAEQWGGTEQ